MAAALPQCRDTAVLSSTHRAVQYTSCALVVRMCIYNTTASNVQQSHSQCCASTEWSALLQFRRLVDQADWVTIAESQSICVEGEQFESVVMITRGHFQLQQAGRNLATLGHQDLGAIVGATPLLQGHRQLLLLQDHRLL